MKPWYTVCRKGREGARKAMNKNVYSLVLSEDVVAEIDRLAYRKNTNRSNMINQILAEYVSYTTPEKRMREVFDRIEHVLTAEDAFQLLFQPSDTMLSLRSALAYKYNPTVRYAVELYRAGGEDVGELRVSLRTQNRTLLWYTARFFSLWAAAEARIAGIRGSVIEEGRFTRPLRLRRPEGSEQERMTGDTLGLLLASYINCFDGALKEFFEDPDSPAAGTRIEERYLDWLRTQRCGV